MRRMALCAVVASLALAGCAARSKSAGKTVNDDEKKLAEVLMEGCEPRPAGPEDELVLYCSEEAVLFGVKDLGHASPDQVFQAWIDEQSASLDGKLEIVERTESKRFGPQYTALYLKLRTPETPPDGYIEAYVAALDQGNTTRRLWCTAVSSQPSGIYRCESDLTVMASLRMP